MKGSRVVITLGANQLGAKALDGVECELVFAVEVGGDHQHAILVESVQCLVVDFRPGGIAIPEILMAHEGDVKVVAELVQVGKFRGVLDEEIGGGGAVQVFPSLPGFSNFPVPDIESGEVDPLGAVAKDVCQHGSFVRPATGEVEELDGFVLLLPGWLT